MPKLDTSKLQALIDHAAETSRAFHKAHTALSEECIRVYGCEPADVDCDEIIDGVLGGNGFSPGMSASAFDKAMRASIANSGAR